MENMINLGALQQELSKVDYSKDTSGINIPQMLVAGIENALLTGGNLKDSLYVAASVGVSNLIPTMEKDGNPQMEKVIVEPIAAGVLYAAVKSFMASKDKNLLKSFIKGFLVGSSSNALTAYSLLYWNSDKDLKLQSMGANTALRTIQLSDVAPKEKKYTYPKVMIS